MSTRERLIREQVFHDRQAQERAQAWCADARFLYFDEQAYLDHETWIRPALAQLGDVAGAAVLDLGCGHGMAALALARRGARVTALDLSRGYLREAEARARCNGVDVSFVQGDGENLPFADKAFARIWGNAILHHLDPERAGREIHRVLEPGGWAVFCEPWGGNPLLSWARRALPYPGKNRTADEEPLHPQYVQKLARYFPGLELRGFQLLSMARRVVGVRCLQKGLEWCDAQMLPRCRGLQHWCRYVMLTLRRA